MTFKYLGKRYIVSSLKFAFYLLFDIQGLLFESYQLLLEVNHHEGWIVTLLHHHRLLRLLIQVTINYLRFFAHSLRYITVISISDIHGISLCCIYDLYLLADHLILQTHMTIVESVLLRRGWITYF